MTNGGGSIVTTRELREQRQLRPARRGTLSCIGCSRWPRRGRIYGVTAYTTRQGHMKIGVRMGRGGQRGHSAAGDGMGFGGRCRVVWPWRSFRTEALLEEHG